MSEIKPALTAEEWKAGGWYVKPEYHIWTECSGDCGVEDRHAMAATCLHGQPFGFTREDVIALRAMQDRINFEALDRGIPSVKDLADRIEALLPPEETELLWAY